MSQYKFEKRRVKRNGITVEWWGWNNGKKFYSFGGTEYSYIRGIQAKPENFDWDFYGDLISDTELIPFYGIEETAVLPTKTTQGKENMEPYSFISSESEIDFVRIVREANNHPFIQVDIQDRRGRSTDDVYFFVHNDILKNKDLQGITLIDRPIEPRWGGNDLKGQVLFSYRSINGCKKDIPTFKNHVAHIKALLSPKNRKTFVTLL